MDDDALALRVYCEGLMRLGFQVEVATDGLGALKLLHSAIFDVLILDLLMPRFSGAEVLNYVRRHPELTELPVIMLSNGYVREAEGAALTAGAQRELLKVECTPAILGQAIKEVLGARLLAGSVGFGNASQGLRSAAGRHGAGNTGAKELRKGAQAAARAGEWTSGPRPAGSGSGPALEKAGAMISGAARLPARLEPLRFDANRVSAARQNFVAHARSHCLALRNSFERYKRASTPVQRELQLTDLFRKVRFITALAGFGDFPPVVRLGTPLEALLFRCLDEPEHVGSARLRTVGAAIEWLNLLLEAAAGPIPLPNPSGKVLVVHDEPVATRAMTTALNQAQLSARTTANPQGASEWLQQEQFDLLVLDLEMRGLDGFEFCRQLRGVPCYARTPVIYITSHRDFHARARALLTGAEDFITRPIVPMELAVKALTYVLKSRLSLAVPEAVVADAQHSALSAG